MTNVALGYHVERETKVSDFGLLYDQVSAFFLEKLDTQISPVEADLIESGYLDSLTFVELILYLEQDLGARFSIDDLELDSFRSIEEIVLFVQNHSGAKNQA